MDKSEKIIEDCIQRFLAYSKEYLKMIKSFKKSHSAGNHIQLIQFLAYIDESLYTIKKYANKEQKLRIKQEMGRDFRKFF